MGYEIHITRKENWHDEDEALNITQKEWEDYISSDKEMRLDGFSEIVLQDGKVFRTEDPSLAIWTAYSGDGVDHNHAWIWLSNGNIDIKNPDQEIINKMLEISAYFGAKVQGDEEEIYTKNDLGHVEGSSIEKIKEPKKPWWRFW